MISLSLRCICCWDIYKTTTQINKCCIVFRERRRGVSLWVQRCHYWCWARECVPSDLGHRAHCRRTGPITATSRCTRRLINNHKLCRVWRDKESIMWVKCTRKGRQTRVNHFGIKTLTRLSGRDTTSTYLRTRKCCSKKAIILRLLTEKALYKPDLIMKL